MRPDYHRQTFSARFRTSLPPRSAAKAEVSVIVPVKNEAGNLGRCLPATFVGRRDFCGG